LLVQLLGSLLHNNPENQPRDMSNAVQRLAVTKDLQLLPSLDRQKNVLNNGQSRMLHPT